MEANTAMDMGNFAHNIEHLQTQRVLEQVRKIVLFEIFDALIPFFLCN